MRLTRFIGYNLYYYANSRAIGDNWEELKECFRRGTDDRQTTITSLETQALQPLKRTVVGELEGKFKQVRHPLLGYTCIFHGVL